MRVLIRFNFFDEMRDKHTRGSFWTTFSNRALGAVTELLAEQPDFGEKQVKRNFAQILGRLINNKLRDDYNSYVRRGLPRWRILGTIPPNIECKFLLLRYGSLEVVLDMLGINSDVVKQSVLELTELYAPLALNEILRSDVEFNVSVEDMNPTVTNQKVESGVLFKLLANGGLVIPVILAVWICKVAFDGILQEAQGIRTESQAMRAERTELMKMLVDQNTKLSSSLVDAAKAAIVDAKAAETLHANIMKARGIALGLLPPEAQQTTVKTGP